MESAGASLLRAHGDGAPDSVSATTGHRAIGPHATVKIRTAGPAQDSGHPSGVSPAHMAGGTFARLRRGAPGMAEVVQYAAIPRCLDPAALAAKQP